MPFPSFLRGDPFLHAPVLVLLMDSGGVPPPQTMTRITNGSHVPLKVREEEPYATESFLKSKKIIGSTSLSTTQIYGENAIILIHYYFFYYLRCTLKLKKLCFCQTP